jgi:hypothetical protein
MIGSSRLVHLIIGAGDSDIQLALLLSLSQTCGLTFTILEKEDVVGSFWTKFSVFGEVISAKKCTRNHKEL